MNKIPPYRYYFFSVLVLLFGGLLDSFYLSLTHYWNYTELAYRSFCALSQSFNCDTVAQSPYSILFGLPLAFWGIFAYLLYGIIFFIAWKQGTKKTALWSLLLLLSFFYSAFSTYLGYISATKIHSYCIMCLVSYAANFSLFYFSFKIHSQVYRQPFFKSLHVAVSQLFSGKLFLVCFCILCIALFLTKSLLPHYWDYTETPLSTALHHGLTEEGDPWIGAEKPALTIEEYTDYECFQCYKMHFFLRRLVERYPDKIRLIHRNYPLDNIYNPVVVPSPFHVGSGKLALLAVYASTQGKFWEVNDALYSLARKKEPFNTKMLAQITGIPSSESAAALQSPDIKKILTRDIWKGMKLRITATPTFVINGKVYQGSIPPEILDKVIR